jgi:hypothetical protein
MIRTCYALVKDQDRKSRQEFRSRRPGLADDLPGSAPAMMGAAAGDGRTWRDATGLSGRDHPGSGHARHESRYDDFPVRWLATPGR